MSGAGSPRMEYSLSVLIVICLGLGSNGLTSEVVTLPMHTNEPDDTFATALNRHDGYTTPPSNEERRPPGKPEHLLSTITNIDDLPAITVNDFVGTSPETSPETVSVATATSTSLVNSTNTLEPLTTTRRDDITQAQMTETRPAIPTKSAPKTESAGRFTSPKPPNDDATSPPNQRTVALHLRTTITASRSMEESGGSPTRSIITAKKSPSRPTMISKVQPEAADDQRVIIHTDDGYKLFDKDVHQASREDEEDTSMYEESPEYIQRRTINHAAVWITVGFVAILLTYILALFIHEKGRSEWKLATLNYSQFENEEDKSQDDTSITIDLDEPSSPFRDVSPEIVSTETTQYMLVNQPVVDTTKSH